jgi:hypothetical protein
MSHRLDRPTIDHGIPIAVGARVRLSGHRYPEAVRKGSAEVVESVPWSDGTWEYLVCLDRDASLSWWASYHTIEVRSY